jgi:hypothetical protein
METPKNPNLNPKLKKPLGSTLGLVVGSGIAFAGIDYAGNLLYRAIKPFFIPNMEEKRRLVEEKNAETSSKAEFDKNELRNIISKN